ncbi:MAG: beta strand repeat-containing protein, partial [Planctomycetia bacterium]
MGRPLDSLLSQLTCIRFRGGHRGRSVFSPRQGRQGSLRLDGSGSSSLTLAAPESLERRAVMDIGAGMSYSTAFGTAPTSGTLGIWIDDSDVNNDGAVDVDVFIRRNADNTISVANSSSFSAASMLAVEGQKQATPAPIKWSGVNAIQVFRTAGLSSASLVAGGSGYTKASTLTASFSGGTFLSGPTVWDGTTFTSGAPTLTATLNVTSVTLGGTQSGGSSFAVGDSVALSGGGGTGACVTVTSVDANNKITGISGVPVTTGTGYLTMPTGIVGAPGLTITASGAVNAVSITSPGFGYATAPNITFTGGGGGSGAQFRGILDTPPVPVLGSITVDSVANPLIVPLSIGNITFGTGGLSMSPAVVNLTGIANSVSIGGNISALPVAVNLKGIMDTTANAAASISVNADGPINVNAAINTKAVSLTTFLTGGDLTITGGGVTTSGDISLITGDGAISVGGPLSVGGNLVAQAIAPSNPINFAAPITALSIFAQAGSDLEANADLVATGAGGIQLQSDTAQVILSANVTADPTIGAIIISSPDGLGVLDTITPAVISGQSLSLTEGAAALADYTLNANVSVFTAQNLASNITLVNAKALTVGTGPVTTFGDSLTIQTTSGNLTVSGAITAADPVDAGNITLKSAGNVTITSGSVTALNRTISVIASGNVVASSLLNATGTGGLVDVTAGSGINLGSNFRANSLSARTTTGNVAAQSTGTAVLNVLNATTGTGSVSIQSTSGNLDLAGNIATGSGAISLRSTAANINVLSSANITNPGGTVTIRTDARNIDINGTITTSPGGTLVLTASNATGGVISNGSAANVTTGTLNYTASNASSLLNTATYGNLAATLTKSGENLTLTNNGTLKLLSVAVNNGNVDIGANSGLTVSGPVNVGAVKNVSLSSSNGSVTGSGLITGNVLNVVSKGDATLTTNVASLTANITGTGNLTISEQSGLQLNTGNVFTSGGFVNITAGTGASGSLNGTGVINATSSGNVTLRNANGAIVLNASSGQVSGNILNVAANGATFLNTNVSTLIANITGSGQGLTVNETNALLQVGSNVTTNNG